MPKRINPPLPSRTLEHAHVLRQTGTDAEHKLWQRLRGGKLNGSKFRRQHPIPPYIAHFVCLRARLVVELDGSQHGNEQDATRTRFLEAQGFKVMRFWDNDVLRNTDAVLEAILSAVENRTLTPTPLPEGEGLQEQNA
ncbi:MAG TPA: endonuclease domain-containing protein [Rhodanobacteraceae bacterium]|nr:endonuclease domain-containing protein [Rhodanobacteraceae bacterium]